MLRIVQLLAVLSMALSLVPAGAHVMELPAKIGLARDGYIAVQQIYRGWELAGAFLIAALLLDALLAIMSRGQRAPCWWAIAAACLMAAVLVSFFALIYPVDLATRNWTVAPDNWELLRQRWEWAHAGNAGLTLLALIATLLSVLSWREVSTAA